MRLADYLHGFRRRQLFGFRVLFDFYGIIFDGHLTKLHLSPKPVTVTFVNFAVPGLTSIRQLPVPLQRLIFHTKLDNCNCVYYKLPKSQLSRLQQIYNSLARTVVKAPKSCHITSILRSLHWLRITERIEYKLLSLAYTKFSQPLTLHTFITLSLFHVLAMDIINVCNICKTFWRHILSYRSILAAV